MRKLSLSATVLTLVALAFATLNLPARAEDPSGTVTLESTSIAIGIGVQWGSGTLTLKDGSTHSFSVDGLSVLDLGASKVKATGEVFGLTDIADFPGDYASVEASATIGTMSKGDLVMKNQNDVIIHLTPVAEGVQLTAAAKGMILKMK